MILANGTSKYVVRKLTCPYAQPGKYVQEKDIHLVIDHNADVYDEEGKLLLRFRKNVLPLHHVQQAYDAMIQYARLSTTTRGTASGSKDKHVGKNKHIASNVMGYFDWWTIRHRHMFKTIGLKEPPFKARVTRFTHYYPDKWERVIPLIHDIDRMYNKLVPRSYKLQRVKADETSYVIPNTAFSTVTTNLNVRTAVHVDKGNLQESFGNLVVIEKGKYEGGYTCYPEYGIGVDVRTGDFLAMDIHRPHGNTSIIKKKRDTERLSIVCYLRQAIWEKTRGSTKEEVLENMKTMEDISEKYISIKRRKAMRHV